MRQTRKKGKSGKESLRKSMERSFIPLILTPTTEELNYILETRIEGIRAENGVKKGRKKGRT